MFGGSKLCLFEACSHAQTAREAAEARLPEIQALEEQLSRLMEESSDLQFAADEAAAHARAEQEALQSRIHELEGQLKVTSVPLQALM